MTMDSRDMKGQAWRDSDPGRKHLHKVVIDREEAKAVTLEGTHKETEQKPYLRG